MKMNCLEVVPPEGLWLEELAQTSVEELFGPENRLPWELVLQIFFHLDISALGQAGCVNKVPPPLQLCFSSVLFSHNLPPGLEGSGGQRCLVGSYLPSPLSGSDAPLDAGHGRQLLEARLPTNRWVTFPNYADDPLGLPHCPPPCSAAARDRDLVLRPPLWQLLHRAHRSGAARWAPLAHAPLSFVCVLTRLLFCSTFHGQQECAWKPPRTRCSSSHLLFRPASNLLLAYAPYEQSIQLLMPASDFHARTVLTLRKRHRCLATDTCLRQPWLISCKAN